MRVEGLNLGFGVPSLGFGVWNMGVEVWDLGVEAQCRDFRGQGLDDHLQLPHRHILCHMAIDSIS